VEDIGYATNYFDNFLTKPPVDTINPALLSLCTDDLDHMVADNPLLLDDVTLAKSLFILAEDSSLFISFTDDSLALSETSSGENPEVKIDSPSTSLKDFQGKDPQPAGSGDPIISIPTPPSEPSFPAVQGAKKTIIIS
jgi:hypothetical protein